VIDDDKLVRDFLVTTLEYSVNRDILTFDNGFSAWVYINKPEPSDLIISDANIPEIDGIKLLSKIKKSYPKKKYILMSGNPEHEKIANQLGADAFLAKPFTVYDIFDIVQKFIVEGESATLGGTKAN